MAEMTGYVPPEAPAKTQEPEIDKTEETPESPINTPEIELSQEQKERVSSLRQYVKSTKEREEAREVKSYPGIFGKTQRWLETTGWGKAVKVGGKVVIGAAAATGATVLTGGAGLALAPLLYSLGLKSAIDGGIEAAQYYVGKKSGRSRRLAIEGLKADVHKDLQENYNRIAQQAMSGEISKRQEAVELNKLARAIRQHEESLMEAQNRDIKQSQKEAFFRAIASTIGSVGATVLGGLPLGIQNFDHAFDGNNISHAVKLTTHGFGFIQKAGEAISVGSYHYLGATMHELGTQYGMPLLGKIGVGTAIAGLLAKTGFEAWKIGGNKMISEQPPDFLQIDPVGPQPEKPTEPTQPKPVEPTEPAPKNPTTPEPTPAPTTPTPEASTPTSPETPVMEKSTEFSTFINEIRKKLPILRVELDEINQTRDNLDKEWSDLDRAPYKTAGTDQRRREIEEEHAKLTDRANKIAAELSRLHEFERLDNHSEELDQKLSALDQEYKNIDQKGNGTLTEQKLMQQIMAEHETITRERSELRRKMLEIFEALTQRPVEEPIAKEVPPATAMPIIEPAGPNATDASTPEPQSQTDTSSEDDQEPGDTKSGKIDVTDIDSICDFTRKTELEIKESYEKSLDRAIEALKNVGGIVELRRGVPTVVLPDLHGRRDMLLKALAQKNPQGVTILDQLKTGKINLVCLGDGMHTEVPENWERNDGNKSAKMKQEMVASLGTMKMIMELKAQYPDSFHYLRGNHDDVMGGFFKYANESEDVRQWMTENMGKEFLNKWAKFEKSLPLMATGENLVLSHSAPGIVLTREQIENRAEFGRDKNKRAKDAFRYLAWTDNTELPYSLRGDTIINPTLDNLGMPSATWLIGHRNVDTNNGLYRNQFDNKLIQINNPNRPVMATILADGKFENIKFI